MTCIEYILHLITFTLLLSIESWEAVTKKFKTLKKTSEYKTNEIAETSFNIIQATSSHPVPGPSNHDDDTIDIFTISTGNTSRPSDLHTIIENLQSSINCVNEKLESNKRELAQELSVTIKQSNASLIEEMTQKMNSMSEKMEQSSTSNNEDASSMIKASTSLDPVTHQD